MMGDVNSGSLFKKIVWQPAGCVSCQFKIQSLFFVMERYCYYFCNHLIQEIYG